MYANLNSSQIPAVVAAVSAAGRMLGEFRVTLPVGVMLLALDPESESDFQPFADSGSS